MPVPCRPTKTFEEFFRHIKKLGFDPEICIDVGAGDGTGVIYEAFPKALHIAFEPLPDFHARLAKRLSKFNHEIHHCALMESEGTHDILRTEHNLYGSSMMHKREPGDERLIQVPVKRLDDVMKGREISGRMLLKTDCQGADLLVVKGGEKTLQDCDIVILELSFFRFWGDHQSDFFEVVSYMHGRGFVVYDLLDGLFRPSDGALGQIDVAFAKERGFLRQSRKW